MSRLCLWRRGGLWMPCILLAGSGDILESFADGICGVLIQMREGMAVRLLLGRCLRGPWWISAHGRPRWGWIVVVRDTFLGQVKGTRFRLKLHVFEGSRIFTTYWIGNGWYTCDGWSSSSHGAGCFMLSEQLLLWGSEMLFMDVTPDFQHHRNGYKGLVSQKRKLARNYTRTRSSTTFQIIVKCVSMFWTTL